MEQQQFQSLVLDQFRLILEEMRDMRRDIRHIEDKVSEVHQARNTVKIKFGFAWTVMSLLIAIIASGITQLFGS